MVKRKALNLVNLTYCCWVYTHKEKNEARQILQDFIVGIKCQYGYDIKVLRLDNSTKYGGDKLLSFLKERGIKLELIVPYTPEQDGVSERGFQTLFERVRTTSINLGVPKNLWPELVCGMAYILNQTSTTTLKNCTPIKALEQQIKGSKASLLTVSHIRVLRCKAYVHTQKERRQQGSKLDPCTETGILVGFKGHNIYQV